jgi:hypothetical protein
MNSIQLRLKATAKHEEFYKELCWLLGKYSNDVDASEALAIAANMLGKLIALQDQRTMTPKRAMEIVTANLIQGNEDCIDGLKLTEGSA